MRGSLFLIVLVCLFLVVSAYSQGAISVDESKLSATLKTGSLVMDVPVSSNSSIPNATAILEILDENDSIVAKSESVHALKGSSQILSIPVTLSVNTEKLLWYRLRYNISQPGSPNSITNTVALSEITPEVFELQVTAPRNVVAGMNVRVHVLAIHPYTKKPIRNVDVTGNLELELDTDDDEDELKLIAKARTNSDGVATVEFKIPTSAKLENWGADLTIEGKKHGVMRKAENDLDVSEDAFAYLQTDKPIYQPNQKLSARCLFLKNSRRPIAGQELGIEIRNEEGSTVFERTVTTSRFGIANVEWVLPADIKLGKYVIEVEDDDSDEVGRAEFRVSRYDLPNFVVNAKAAKSFYLLDEGSAAVTVDAKYLFGKPVAAGKVKIVEEYGRKWSFESQSWEVGKGAIYEGETDANGKFTVEIGLGEASNRLLQEDWKRFDDVQFTAYFTDATTNRTEQRQFDIRISKEPIHIYFIRPGADPSAAIPYQFYVSTFYADGTPAKTNLDLSGYYENATTDERLAHAKTNSYGAAKFEFKFPQKPFDEAKNIFNFRIKATDANGKTGSLSDNIYITEKRQIRVKTDKTIYAPNDPIFAKILTTEKGPLFVDVTKDSNVIWSRQITVNDGVGGVTIPYRPDFKGELTITAYSYDEDENADFSLWNKTILFPKPAELDLDLKAVKATYRPGEDARLAFSVKDASGVEAESALGIVMLDKAIEERARTEQLPDNLADLRKLLGTADAIGDLTRNDLDKIDTSKPVSTDLQLAAEYLLSRSYSRPRSFSSESYTEDFGTMYRPLLQKQLAPLADALRKRYEEGSEYPTDETQLTVFGSTAGIEINEMRDAWKSPYVATFRRERGDDVLELRSASADKKIGTSDDFLVTDIRFQWFLPTLNRITKLTGLDLPDGPKPRTAEEARVLISKAGFDIASVKDDSGRPVQINSRIYTRESIKTWLETVGNFDGAMQQVPRSKAVTQEVVVHNFVSGGQDGIVGNYDDIILGSTVTVLSEKDIEGVPEGKVLLSRGPSSSNKGAIGGTIVDANRAVITNASVTVENAASKEGFAARTDVDGSFLITNLPSSRYNVRAESTGFRTTRIENVIVTAFNLVNVFITLEVGNVTSVVEVTAAPSQIDQTSNAISASITTTKSNVNSIAGMMRTKQAVETFTPRVRQYFPETLVWQPELITDKNGNASFDFKLADNLTTWKLYAFGSTESGEFGFVEKEIQTFQPFFAELDPPKILTEGDEIALPVPIRNYTDKRQRVTASMAQNAWSRMPNGSPKQIDVAPNSTQNAVFDFVAAVPVKDGKQKVSVIAGGEGDAIEKAVTVKPNGREEISTQSETFLRSAAFDVNFPAEAFAANRSARLKIYPNMLSHVAESVEGLLVRPHGCGEQTTSSTYPNLMILKLEKELGKPIDANLKAQAQTYLAEGYKRLLNYQTPSGGFSYWGVSDTPNPVLTAYVLRFLTDAEGFIDVDENVVVRAKTWLANQQRGDGSWMYANEAPASTSAYIVRSLLNGNTKDENELARVNAGFAYLEKDLDKTTDAYTLANIALIAAKIGKSSAAERALNKLSELARIEKGKRAWSTESTPFHGWGKPAAIETTAIAVRAFVEFRKIQKADLRSGDLISGGLKYLLANKDSNGVWYSTQTTVNVLNTIIALQKSVEGVASESPKLVVRVNGSTVKELTYAMESHGEPIDLDIREFLDQAHNRIELIGGDQQNLLGAQIVVTYYSDWTAPQPESKFFELKVSYDKTSARIGEDITATVEMRRKNYFRHGMVLTEIGLPPGADVDRSQLDSAQGKGAFSRYDILPDKVVIYSWSSAEPLVFSFKFKHRYGINAQTAPSTVYDYYNPEAQATVAPIRFQVK